MITTAGYESETEELGYELVKEGCVVMTSLHQLFRTSFVVHVRAELV